MTAGPETKLVARIVKAIRAEWPDAWCFKVHGNPYQSSGIPDLLIVVEGRLVGIEVKARRPGESEAHARGRVTLQQQAEINRLRAAGATAGSALSVEEATALVRRALDPRG